MPKQMKVLVTGAGGFVGKHVVEELEAHNYDVIKHQGKQDEDLRKQVSVDAYLKCHAPDVVIHLAATVGGIGANQRSPGAFFYDNMVMGLNMINSSYKLGVEKFVLLSTVCSYPKHCPIPFKEDDIWNGYPEETNAPYGIAKKALMEMLSAYRKQYNFQGITLIPVNMYGPGDNFNLENSHVIPAMIHKIAAAVVEGDPFLNLWGTGGATREFLYVKDCARAIRLAMESYSDNEPVNIGTGKEISIKSLAEHICTLMNYTGKVVWDISKPDGQPRRCLNIDRATKFGFSPEWDLESGLIETIDWFCKKQMSRIERATNYPVRTTEEIKHD